ncbi:MAG: GntR family transcriptional regulator [Firmicutes bacterium]|nr:GntR family transcriptional regulator [Bacillota bacterium]MCL5038750.1 GntR family transcriptional regulator [Bacillota bacterium]
MWFHIDTTSGTPVYLQIYQQAKQAVAAGVLRSGEQLPSVRALAEGLVINPNTVARAYQELERDGIIEIIRGKGAFVAARKAELVLSREERLRRLTEAFERLKVEAYHLGFTPEELRDLLEVYLTEGPARPG